jgi:uncharacterized protein YaaN involved in tellurite resistance
MAKQNKSDELAKVNDAFRPKLKSEEAKAKAKELASGIDHTAADSILNFGVEAQNKLSKNSEEMLDKIKTKDAGDVGDTITELLTQLNYVDVENLTEKKSFLATIPFIGQLFDKAKNTMVRYNSVAENIDGIVRQLDGSRKTLIKDSVTLDNLHEKNIEYVEELNINVEAGYIKLDEVRDKLIPEKKKEIKENPGDEMLIQELADLQNFENNLEKKVHDLELSRAATIQTLPQIRLIQNNNDVLVEKIQSSVMTTIPLWKNQVTVALAINRQKKVLEMSKKMSDTTNDLLSKNSKMLKQNTIETAKQNERGVLDISTLKQTNKDLISVVDEVSKIQIEGRKAREKAKEELAKIENELHEKILAARGESIDAVEDAEELNETEVRVDSMFAEKEEAEKKAAKKEESVSDAEVEEAEVEEVQDSSEEK